MRLDLQYVRLGADSGDLVWFLAIPRRDVMFEGRALPFGDGEVFDELWSLADWQINKRGFRPQLINQHGDRTGRFALAAAARRHSRDELIAMGVPEVDLAQDVPEWIAFGFAPNAGVTAADLGNYVSAALNTVEVERPDGPAQQLLFTEFSTVDTPQVRSQPPASALGVLNDAPLCARLGAVMAELVGVEDFNQRLNRAVDRAVTDDRTRADVVRDMASEAGISPSTVNQILDGDIDRPPENRIRGFARALGVSGDALVEELGENPNAAEMAAGGNMGEVMELLRQVMSAIEGMGGDDETPPAEMQGDDEEEAEMSATLSALRAENEALRSRLNEVGADVVALAEQAARAKAEAKVAELDFELSAERRESLIALAVSAPETYESTVETIREVAARAASHTATGRTASTMPAGGAELSSRQLEYNRVAAYQREHNAPFDVALRAVRAEEG